MCLVSKAVPIEADESEHGPQQALLQRLFCFQAEGAHRLAENDNWMLTDQLAYALSSASVVATAAAFRVERIECDRWSGTRGQN